MRSKRNRCGIVAFWDEFLAPLRCAHLAHAHRSNNKTFIKNETRDTRRSFCCEHSFEHYSKTKLSLSSFFVSFFTMSYESLNGKQNSGKNGFDSSSFRQGAIRSAAASVASGASSFRMRSHENEHLSEPLTAGHNDSHHEDPYFVFRADLIQQLELVDEGLAEFLRVVHQTVSLFSNIYRFIGSIFHF